MSSYYEKAKGQKITDLKEDGDFKKDLIRFMSSSRKNYSIDELKEKGFDWMLDEYVEHMRSQDTNEATALQDLYFAKDENARAEDRAAFGRLMTAWDASEGAGTGRLKGTGDYIEAIATSPSTIAGIFTGGFSRLGGAAAAKAASIGTRAAVQKVMSKEFAKEAAKGFVRSAAVEGTIAAGQIEAQEGAREATVEDYEGMTAAEKAISVGANAFIGGSVGGFAGAMDRKTIDTAALALEKQSVAISKKKKEISQKATKKITKASKKNKEKVDRVLDRMSSLNEALTKRRSKLQALDPIKVKEGLSIKDAILKDGSDANLSSGLSRSTMKGIAAATLDLVGELKVGKTERISSAMARGLEEGTISSDRVSQIIDEYGLSREEFGYVFLADLSEAGRTLGEAGRISRDVQKTIFDNMEKLADQGVTSNNDTLARQVADAVGTEKTRFDSLVDIARASDSLRIAFMTSQLGTTAANAMFSTARIGIDVVDEAFRQTLNIGTKAVKGEGVPLSNFHAVTSGIRSMTLSKNDAVVLKGMFERDLPEEYNKIFHDINRVEMNADLNTAAGKVGSAVNLLNSAVDSRFKQAAFYSSVDRQLIETGSSVSEFLKNNNSLLDLPESIREKAVYDTLDFVFQKGYGKKDFGGIANTMIKAHKKYPFMVSGFLGMPFPRYVANHMEFINDYTPIALVTGGKKNFDKIYSGELKDVNERWARQLTGVTLFTGAVYARASQVEFDEDGNATGMKTNFSDMQFGDEGEVSKLGRVSGALAAHTLLADLWVRHKYDLPMPEFSSLAKDTLEVAGGLGNMGLDKSLISDVERAFEDGAWGALGGRLADIGATFTYPATVVRDLQGQIDPELGYTPYTRSLLMSDTNLLDAMLTDTEAFNRLVRFLPETRMAQYTQSFNGKTSTVIMDPFAGTAVRAVNPMTKQILGIEKRATQTTIQKEMATLGLKDYQLYRKSQLRNPATDYLVRYALAASMPKNFEKYISEPLKIYNGARTYQDLNEEEKKFVFKKFVSNEIQTAKGVVEMYWEELSNKNPRAAASYIRNAYAITEKAAPKSLFQKAAESLSNGKLKNPGDYIADADSIEEELSRRQELMRLVNIQQDQLN